MHGSKAPSCDVIRYSLRHWSTFYSGKELNAVNPQSIDDFISDLRGQNLSNGSINRILSDGRAAINRAHKYGEIKSAPFVKSLPKGESFKFRPTVKMFGKFFDAIGSDQLFRYMIIRLCTACRNDAAMDLVKSQVDFQAGLVNLNPEGREQTKKHRPTVPLSPTLKYWLEQWDEPLIQYHGKKVKSIRQAWRKTRIRAALPADFIQKAIRHSVATEIRRCGVPQWELSGFLGHRTGTTTDDYAIYDPNYLSGCIDAIEGFLVQIQRHTSKVIIPSKKDLVRLVK
jgi:integrase